jgi:pyrrolysine biosynthesis protein PylC
MREGTPASGIADKTVICDVRELHGSGGSGGSNSAGKSGCLSSSGGFGSAGSSGKSCGFGGSEAPELLRSADLVLPALEDVEALDAIASLSESCGLPLAFSPAAYEITSSKLMSDELIHRLGIPAPVYAEEFGGSGNGRRWIVKPSDGSGSRGVRVFRTLEEANSFAAAQACGQAHVDGADAGDQTEPDSTGRGGLVVQEYLEGDSYSVEVIGRSGAYRTYAITEIHVDSEKDCNLVTTPCAVTPAQDSEFRDSAVKLAEAVGLYGIMDVESILNDGMMKVLEIDARLPSQTPAAILASTGVNMVAELADLVAGGFAQNAASGVCDATQEAAASPAAQSRDRARHTPPRCASYENIIVTREGVRSLGEHIMGSAGPLTLREGWCGADESLTDYRDGCTEFRGIFINSAETEEDLAKKREQMYEYLGSLLR